MSPLLLSRIGKLGLSITLLSPGYGQHDSLDNLVAQGRELQAEGQFAQAEAIFRTALQQAEQRNNAPNPLCSLIHEN